MDGLKKVTGSSDILNNQNNIDYSIRNSDEINNKNIKTENIDPKIAVEEFKKNFEKLKHIIKTEAEFNIDKDTGIIVVKIKDKENGEIIRQIPPEVALRLAKNIGELLGMLFDERA